MTKAENDARQCVAIVLGAQRKEHDPSVALRLAATAEEFLDYLAHKSGLGLPSERILNLFDSDPEPLRLSSVA